MTSAEVRAAEFRAAIAYLSWNRKTAAERLGVSPQTISNWSAGRHPVPKMVMLVLNAAMAAEDVIE